MDLWRQDAVHAVENSPLAKALMARFARFADGLKMRLRKQIPALQAAQIKSPWPKRGTSILLIGAIIQSFSAFEK